MAVERRPKVAGYLLLLAVALVVAGYLARMVRTDNPRAFLGVLAVAGLILFPGFREGFTRHDWGHQRYFFAYALAVLAWFVGSARSLLFRMAALVAVLALATGSLVPTSPQDALGRWSTGLQLLLDRQHQSSQLAETAAALRTGYALPPQVLAAATGHPIAIDPTEITLAWAYHLNWRPAVVFQTYSAYTAQLDRRNADFLANAAPDQEVLRTPSAAIDGRNPLWDPPRYVLTELCNYRVVMAEGTWMLLHKSQNRCSAPTQIASLNVAARETITPPKVRPDQILVMSFQPDEPSLPVRLGRLLNKSLRPLTVTANNHSYRLPRSLAAGPLLIDIPARTGWPPRFGGGTAYTRLTLNEPGTITFHTITLANFP
jgi:hypothetical protein